LNARFESEDSNLPYSRPAADIAARVRLRQESHSRFPGLADPPTSSGIGLAGNLEMIREVTVAGEASH
jgi:hypothetical protein